MSNKAYCVNTGSYVDIKLKEFKILGKAKKVGNVACASVGRDGDPNTYSVPWDHIHNIRKRGEENCSAKLTSAKVRNIVRAHFKNPKLKYTETAKKYGMADADQISLIARGKAWTHITVPLLAQLRNGCDEVVAHATGSKNKANKLSASLAKFIVRDHMINKFSIEKLAKKFLVSKSTIRRIVSGKAWSASTVPAIEEYSKWSK